MKLKITNCPGSEILSDLPGHHIYSVQVKENMKNSSNIVYFSLSYLLYQKYMYEY